MSVSYCFSRSDIGMQLFTANTIFQLFFALPRLTRIAMSVSATGPITAPDSVLLVPEHLLRTFHLVHNPGNHFCLHLIKGSRTPR